MMVLVKGEFGHNWWLVCWLRLSAVMLCVFEGDRKKVNLVTIAFSSKGGILHDRRIRLVVQSVRQNHACPWHNTYHLYTVPPDTFPSWNPPVPSPWRPYPQVSSRTRTSRTSNLFFSIQCATVSLVTQEWPNSPFSPIPSYIQYTHDSFTLHCIICLRIVV